MIAAEMTIHAYKYNDKHSPKEGTVVIERAVFGRVFLRVHNEAGVATDVAIVNLYDLKMALAAIEQLKD